MGEFENIITKEQAFSRMANICSRKECCVSEIRTKLTRLKFSDDAVNEIINKLKNAKYIDENRFAQSFINDKLRFNKWGKNKIKLALLQKQIPDDVIDLAFAEFSDELMNQSLQPILEKKWKSIKGNSDYEKRTKLIRFALGKGFDMESVLNCVSKMNLTDSDDDF